MPTPATLREIRRATRHHGIATIRELQLTQRQIDICCNNGTLERLSRGVYADPARLRTPMRDLAAAVAAAGPMGAAWGRSAAHLWGMWDHHPDLPEIVVPYGRYRIVDGATVHRSRALEPHLIVVRDHIRVINPLVTAL